MVGEEENEKTKIMKKSVEIEAPLAMTKADRYEKWFDKIVRKEAVSRDY